MGTFSALLVLCAGNSSVTGKFPAQRPVTRSFDVFFDLRLNKRLSKQSWDWWFQTPLRPLWRHLNINLTLYSTNSQIRVLSLSGKTVAHRCSPWLVCFLCNQIQWHHMSFIAGESNHQKLGCLFNSFWPMDSLGDMTTMRKLFPCNDVIMYFYFV